MERYLKKYVMQDLSEKMVFLAGPRQVGKTTLSKSISKKYDYMSWDIDEDRSRILAKEFKNENLWIFDEIHKYKKWRNYLKGLHDKFLDTQKILVTGSAKLDVLRRGGDSLQGRYHFQRLMPLSCRELGIHSRRDILELYQLSGFPEPFFKGSAVSCNRWSRNYRERIVRQEVATNEQFQDLASIEILYHRLTDIAGNLLSVNSLVEDIQADHKTLTKWLASLERLYAIFRISPFGGPRIKSLKKMQKLFFYDWNAILNEGPRFENFIAVHLLKWVFFEQDNHGRNIELNYYRDKFDHEVDFILIENGKPILFIETKISDVETVKGLKYLKLKYPHVRSIQIHLKGKKEFIDGHGIEHIHCLKFLKELI